MERTSVPGDGPTDDEVRYCPCGCGIQTWPVPTVDVPTGQPYKGWYEGTFGPPADTHETSSPRPSRRPDGVPTRIDLNWLTPAEHAIRAAVEAVEAVGASVSLTQAVMLLQQAREKVADHVEGLTDPTPCAVCGQPTDEHLSSCVSAPADEAPDWCEACGSPDEPTVCCKWCGTHSMPHKGCVLR